MAMVLRRTQSWTHAHCCIWDNTNFKYFLNILNHEESPNSTCIWMSSLSRLNYHSALCSWFASLCSVFCTPSAPELVPGRLKALPLPAVSTAGIIFMPLTELPKPFPVSLTLWCTEKPREVWGRGLREGPLIPDTSPWHDSMFRWVLAQGSGYSLDFNMLFTRRQAPRPWWEGWCALSRLLVLWHGHVHMKLALLSVLCHRPSPQLCKQLQSHFSVRPISTSFLKSLILQSFLPLVALTHVSKQIFHFSPRSP